MKKGERVRAAALKASTARADANKARVEVRVAGGVIYVTY